MEKCKWCDSKNLKFSISKDTVHKGGRLDCLDCGRWNTWIKSGEKEGVRTKTSKHKLNQVLKFHNKEKEICFFCLRTKEKLGEYETLTLDHIEELNEGGKDEIENLQVLCSACHKLKNWVRLYMNWHLEGFYKR